MRITFVDDSFAFDGYSPSSRALNGPEKAFALLPGVLAMRGHAVEVFNRCDFPVNADGVVWHPWDDERPPSTDSLVAFRHPRLLESVAEAARKILWMPGAATALDDSTARAMLAKHRPAIVFFTGAQRDAWANPLGLQTHVVHPGIASAYLEDDAMLPAIPPRALTTVHPLAGLDGIIRLWTRRVRPEVPGAELHVYSAILDRGRNNADIPPACRAVLDLALAAAEQGVVLRAPEPDPQMAQAYRAARAHLYPGQPHELYGFTLAESQAAGLPGIVRATNTALLMRIVDRQSGIVAADEEAMAAGAITLLSDNLAFERMSATARTLHRGRSWAVTASEFEAVLT
jgi:glycosyltransferase involved in cell wall biosynthesis